MDWDFSKRRFLTGLGAAALAVPALANAPQRSGIPKPRPAGGAGGAPEVTLANAPSRSAASLEAIINAAELTGKISFAVADARTGLMLESRGAREALPPASVAKAITAVYGLDSLGSAHKFATQLIATGPISGGVLRGDLVLVGTGDPALDTDGLAAMAGQLKKVGVASISGRFLVYGGRLPLIHSIDPSQPDHVGYNPAISGLNLNYNRVHFQWTPSGGNYAVAMDARSDKYRPAVNMARMSIVNRENPVYAYKRGQNGVDEWSVSRKALGGKAGSRWLPVRRPDLYAGETFQALAGAFGVRLPRPQVAASLPKGTPIVAHQSNDLSRLTRDMLKWSTNITAEVIGLSASQKRGKGAGNLSASAGAMSAWMRAGFGASSAQLVDHSGLSDASRVSAEDLVKMLVKMKPGGALHSHMKVVTPRNNEGQSNAGAAHRINAKTGTLNFVSTLAGYVTTADGNTLAFAILTGDVARRRAIPKAQRERPQGAKSWGGRSRLLQHRLINRWAAVYG